MKFRKFKREYLVFSRKERNASITLVSMIILVTAFPYFNQLFSPESVKSNYASYSNMFISMAPAVTSADLTAEDNPGTNENNDHVYREQNSETNVQRELFYFDPNLITADDWIRLGVPGSIAERIMKYKQNGGAFRSKEDLMKIYGFREMDFIAIENYIVIEQKHSEGIDKKADFNLNVESAPVELNSATETDLISLGFSAVLSKRIINYRNSLGGLYSVQQLEKVFGMQPVYLSEAAEYLSADEKKIKAINLNTCTVEVLMAHGYISDQLAAAIIEYRNTTGRFVSLAEVTKVTGMYPALFEKLKPYLIL